MKKLGLWVFVMMLTLGVGLGTFFYFGGGNQAVASIDKKAEVEHAKKLDETKAKDAEFVELAPLILPIVDKHGVSQVVSLVVSLEVSNKEHTKIVEKISPKLKDAYIQEMYGTLNKKAALEGGVVQVSLIKSKLNKITQDVLGNGIVEDVLLQVVQQRPI
ncbi:MAG: flagellar basal body-associated FliL family protein [Bdellovibrionales bacterium]